MPKLAAAAAPDGSTKAWHGNLPSPLSSFIGREKELTEVKRLLSTARLVTLTGPGGCGKTTLALHVARDMLDAYAAGVIWVELAPLADPELLPQIVAKALGLGEQPGRMLVDALCDALREQVLLVLDNCEHLIDACAQLATRLLQQCPGLHLLATSREALNLAGEVAWLVPSLQVPNAKDQYPVSALQQLDAIRLFIERASAVQSDFKLSEQNAADVARICRRLDGIPLAIELAAARVKVLSVEQIAARLDDALRLLAEGKRAGAQRHLTLRATLDWSHDLLSPAERILFRRLSPFEGGCSLEAVEFVCAGDDLQRGDVLSTLTRLIDKSLLVKLEEGGEARYRMLEPVRQYARERLAEADELASVCRQHFAYFLALAEEVDRAMTGPRQIEWSRRLERTHDNLRAALRWALDSRASEAALLCLALVRFWMRFGYIAESRQWLERALESGRAHQLPRAGRASRVRYGHLLGWASFMAAAQGELGVARGFAEAGLALARELDDQQGVAFSLFNLANSFRQQGDYTAAWDLYSESLALFRQLGDKWFAASALNSLGRVARSRNDYAAARALFEEGLALSRELDDQFSLLMSLRSLHRLAHAQGDYGTARALAQETLALKQESGDKFGIALSLSSLGHVVLAQGDYAGARELLLEGLLLSRELGVKRDLAHNLVGWASLAQAEGQPQVAAKLAGAVEALLETIGARLDEPEQTVFKDAIDGVRAQLDPAELHNAWEAGRQMTLEKAIAEAQQVIVAPSAPMATAAHTGPHDPNALTPRELEVLRLLAGGLTDARIANQLVISRRTVNTHLMSIYGKLGVNSRTAATRYALDHKLI